MLGSCQSLPVCIMSLSLYSRHMNACKFSSPSEAVSRRQFLSAVSTNLMSSTFSEHIQCSNLPFSVGATSLNPGSVKSLGDNGPSFNARCGAAASAHHPGHVTFGDAERRIYSVSDLHTDYSENMKWLEDFAEREQLLSKHADDALIVAGDVSDSLKVGAKILNASGAETKAALS